MHYWHVVCRSFLNSTEVGFSPKKTASWKQIPSSHMVISEILLKQGLGARPVSCPSRGQGGKVALGVVRGLGPDSQMHLNGSSAWEPMRPLMWLQWGLTEEKRNTTFFKQTVSGSHLLSSWKSANLWLRDMNPDSTSRTFSPSRPILYFMSFSCKSGHRHTL